MITKTSKISWPTIILIIIINLFITVFAGYALAHIWNLYFGHLAMFSAVHGVGLGFLVFILKVDVKVPENDDLSADALAMIQTIARFVTYAAALGAAVVYHFLLT